MLLVSCARKPESASPAPLLTPVTASHVAPSPGPSDYLERLARDGSLFARSGEDLVPASVDDVALLRRYPAFADKGPLAPSGQRLTILTAKHVYLPGEQVRVVHVHEATQSGVALYVMGPKAIAGEYVDGALASASVLPIAESYDGAVLGSPGEDHNYEVTVHTPAVGKHTLRWRTSTLSGPEVLTSNVVTFEVRPGAVKASLFGDFEGGYEIDALHRHCEGASGCSGLAQCLGVDSDVSVEDRLHLVPEVAACDNARAALLSVAIQDDPRMHDAVGAVLVGKGILSQAAWQRMPTRDERDRAVAHLMSARRDRFHIIEGGGCELQGEARAGVLELRCRAFDGCVRDGQDRVLWATVQLGPAGWRVMKTEQGVADTGRCGCLQ